MQTRPKAAPTGAIFMAMTSGDEPVLFRQRTSPLFPLYSGGRGDGGEGGFRPARNPHPVARDATLMGHDLARDTNPLTPVPSPPEYRGEGRHAPSVWFKWKARCQIIQASAAVPSDQFGSR